MRELVERERAQTGPATSGHPAQTSPPGDAALAQAANQDLGVEPTPDSRQRISPTTVWDESARPVGPKREATSRYTDEGRAFARDLIRIHDHLRGELTQLRDMIVQVAAGSLDPAAARSAINELTVKQNEWTLGTLLPELTAASSECTIRWKTGHCSTTPATSGHPTRSPSWPG